MTKEEISQAYGVQCARIGDAEIKIKFFQKEKELAELEIRKLEEQAKELEAADRVKAEKTANPEA